jgi:hypothetical protein
MLLAAGGRHLMREVVVHVKTHASPLLPGIAWKGQNLLPPGRFCLGVDAWPAASKMCRRPSFREEELL